MKKMLTIKNLEGKMLPLLDVDFLARKRNLQGELTLEAVIKKTELNAQAFDLIETESILQLDDDQYRIKQVEKNEIEKGVEITLTAIHTLYDAVTNYQYDIIKGEKVLSIHQALTHAFEGTSIKFKTEDDFKGYSFENFGNDNSIALFNKIREAYDCEFEIKNNELLIIKKEVGKKGNKQMRYKHNIKSINVEDNTSNLTTYIKGFGALNVDKEGNTIEDSYKIKTDYTSPNAEKYGIRHATPVYDERYHNVGALKDRLKREIIDEPEFTVQVTYEEFIKISERNTEDTDLGDYIYLIHEPVGLEFFVRVNEVIDYPLHPNLKPIFTISTHKHNSNDRLVDYAINKNNMEKEINEIKNHQTEAERRIEQAVEALHENEVILKELEKELETIENEVIPQVEQAIKDTEIPHSPDKPFPIPNSNLWWNTSIEPARLYRWNGTEWVVLAPEDDEIQEMIDDILDDIVIENIKYTDEKIKEVRENVTKELNDNLTGVFTDIGNLKDTTINTDAKVNIIAGQIELKADKSELRDKVDVQDYEKDQADLTVAYDKITADVSQTKAQVDKNTGQITSASSDISSLKQTAQGFEREITSIHGEVGDLDKKVDNIRVGGRNLVLKSGVKAEGDGYNIGNFDMTEKWEHDTEYTITVNAELGERKTVSFWVNGTGGLNGQGVLDEVEKGVWRKTFKLRSHTPILPGTNTVHIYQTPSNTEHKPFTFHNIQVERGNTGTEWQKAEEDYEAEFESISKKFTKVEEEAGRITSKVGEIESKSEEDMKAVYTEINQLPDRWSVDIKQGIGDLSTATDKKLKDLEGGIKKEIEDVDNKTGNLVKNPAITKSVTGWTGGGVHYISSQSFKELTGADENIGALRQTSTGNDIIYSDWFEVDPTKAYEVSVWVYKSGGRGRHYFGLHGSNNVGSNNVGFDRINVNGTVQTENSRNFYFYAINSTFPKWEKMTGYIMPSGTSLERMKNLGENVQQNAIAKPNLTHVRLRILNYGNAGTSTNIYITMPKVVEINGEAVNHTNTITSINASMEGVTIQAPKVDIKGVVSFINSDGSSATMINGNKLITGSVTANQLNVDNIFGNSAVIAKIQSDSIRTAKLDATQISSGTINANRIGANSITAGKLSVEELSALTANLGTVTAGTINGISIYGSKFYSSAKDDYMQIRGGNIELVRSNGQKVDISPSGIYGYNKGGSVRFQANRLLVTSAALGTSNSNVYLAPDSNNEVRVVDVESIPSDGGADSYNYRPVRAQMYRSPPRANNYITSDLEVRITAQGDTSIYRDVRANGYYGDFLETTASAMFIRVSSGSSVHIVRKGTTTNYQDLVAKDVWNRAMITTTANAYIGADGELRVVNKGLSGIYRAVRAQDFIKSSSVEYKSHFQEPEQSSLDVINKLKVIEYYLDDDLEHGDYYNKQIGVIAELSPEIASRDGKGISDYKHVSHMTRAIQELSKENDRLACEIKGAYDAIAGVIEENDRQQETIDSQQKQLNKQQEQIDELSILVNQLLKAK